jgi:hypothetical protein
MKQAFVLNFAAAALTILTLAPSARAINIGAGVTVTENFDGIGGVAAATLPADWKVDTNNTVRNVGNYSAAVAATAKSAGNNMSATAANGIYNYGAGEVASATDRAVGFISSGSASKTGNLYVKLDNNGASDINSFTISYNVEKYRHGQNPTAYQFQLYYSTDGSTWTSAGTDFLTTFAADGDNNGYAAAPGLTNAVSAKVLTVAVSAGSSLYLCWSYSVATGTTTSNAQGLGVDDVSITANGSMPAEPTTQSSGVSFANVQSRQMDVSWTPGNGASRLVVAKAGSAPTGAPADGTAYPANAAYGTGATALGDGFVVYNGSGSTFTLSGLAGNTTYYVKVFEYNGSGSVANYLTSGTPADGSHATLVSTLSSQSDIVRASGFTEPANIAYALYQEADITDANSIEMARFTLRDGGGSADTDSAATTLTAITLAVVNGGSLRRVALYDGASEIAEVAGGTNVSFSGLAGLAAADGSTKSFSVRATFVTNVVDNQQLQFTVTSATADPDGSMFAAANAGGAASATTGDANRIEVTATKLVFATVPASVGIGQNFAVTVQALDDYNNVDLDSTTAVTLSLASGSGTLGSAAGLTQSLVSGSKSWSDLRMDTIGEFALQAVDGSLAPATSVTITATPPVLAGWDMHAQSGYGTQGMAPTVSDPRVTVGGLTRGTGVGTGGSAAGRAWGGNGWTSTNADSAIGTNQYVTFTITPNSGAKASFASIAKFTYRSSATNIQGTLQYQAGSGDTFHDITTLAYTSSSSSGVALPAIDLSGITALQNVMSGTVVTFRLVNFGTTNSSATWYIFDKDNGAGSDFEVQGTVVSAGSAPAPVTITNIVGTTLTYGGGAGAQFVLVKSASLLGGWTRVHTNFTTPGTFAVSTGSEAASFYRVKSE